MTTTQDDHHPYENAPKPSKPLLEINACRFSDLFGDIPVIVISSNPKYKLNELKHFDITPLLLGMDFKKRFN